MEKVEKYSVGGYVFSLEPEARAAVEAYLGELSAYYMKQESGAEVMEGIEERMAELFVERSGVGGVVSKDVADAVIGTLGRPEDLEGEEPESSPTGAGARKKRQAGKKRDVSRRLYRDMGDKRIGGVCGGLGAYFGLDSSMIRIILATLFFVFMFVSEGKLSFFMAVLYVIFWICVPPARTVSERDALKGQGGTVDSISERVKNNVKDYSKNLAHAGDTARSFGKGLRVVFGVILLLVGILGVATLVTLALSNYSGVLRGGMWVDHMLSGCRNPFLFDFFSDSYVWALLFGICVMPFIIMVYYGVLFTYGLKSPSWHLGLWLLIVWLVLIVVFSVLVTVNAAQGNFV